MIDAVHFPRPATHYWMEMHPEPFRRGFSEFTRYYGMLLEGMDLWHGAGAILSVTHTLEDVDRTVEAFDRTLGRVKAEGLFDE